MARQSGTISAVKLKDLPRALGFRKAPREYPTEIEELMLPAEGAVRFALTEASAQDGPCILSRAFDLAPLRGSFRTLGWKSPLDSRNDASRHRSADRAQQLR